MEKQIVSMVKGILTDDEIMTAELKEKIRKGLERNDHFTTTYAFTMVTVQDIHGTDSKTSGFYFILGGTQTEVRFFINNELEYVRKPNKNKVTVAQEWTLYGSDISHDFWYYTFSKYANR